MEQKLNNCSIYGDTVLIEKFQNEFKAVENQVCIDKIWGNICEISTRCRNYGYKSLIELYEKIDNRFLKDMIYLLSKADNQDEIMYLIHLVTPRFYSFKFYGQEFVESVIYFEALLMILEGEVIELVRVRIASILALNEGVKLTENT